MLHNRGEGKKERLTEQSTLVELYENRRRKKFSA